MTANNRQNTDGSPGRSTGDAAVRGALLVGVAVIIGALLLWRAHDDNGSTARSTTGATGGTAVTAVTTTIKAAVSGPTGPSGSSGSGKTGLSGTTGPSAATGTTPVSGLKKPAEVKVLVANGTGSANGAGNVTAKLQPKGYAMQAAADASTATIAVSRVYYRDGYAEDAKQIARDMAVAEPVEALLERMPENPPVKANAADRAKAANVLVVIGLDKKIPS